MASQRVLIVEDDAATRAVLGAAVRAMEGVEVVTAANGREGLVALRTGTFQLVLADVNMPELDGLSLLQALRADPELARVPVLLLTARGDAVDTYRGFEAGADDYLAKPFDVVELQLRLRALLRRSPAPEVVTITPAGAPARLRVDERRSAVVVDGTEVRLTGSEFGLMKFLLAHPDRWVSVRELLGVLGYGPDAGAPHIVHTHIRNLRQKLRGVGFEEPFPESSKLGYLVETAWLQAV